LIQLGIFSTLTAIRQKKQGVYLVDDDGDEVLLPNKYIPEDLKPGDKLSVFVYTDSEDRLVATTVRPKILLHEFACLRVNQVTPFGAFLDWGLEKDLFVPFKEQRVKMKEGQSHIIYLYNDEESDRLVGSARINRFLEKENISVREGEEVDLLIGKATPLGMNVIINNLYAGLIFKNEIFQNLDMGDRIKGYVKKIRPDNKIDVSLQKQGYGNIEPSADRILDYLKVNNGRLGLTDKSPAPEIMAICQMSKKSFKKAIGALYKKKLIRLEKDGIYLL